MLLTTQQLYSAALQRPASATTCQPVRIAHQVSLHRAAAQSCQSAQPAVVRSVLQDQHVQQQQAVAAVADLQQQPSGHHETVDTPSEQQHQQPQQQQQQDEVEDALELQGESIAAAAAAAIQQLEPQQLQYLQDNQQHWHNIDQPFSSSSSSSRGGNDTGLYDSSRSSNRTKARNPLGGAYTPGEVWHIRRRQPASQLATEFAPSATASASAAAGQQQEQEQSQVQQQQQQQQQYLEEQDLDFDLLDRRSSNAGASTSGRQHTTSSSSSSNSSLNRLQQQRQRQQGDMLDLFSKRSASANFKDPAFEQALSRWMKEAPDWFKVRSVFERYPKRFNIIHVACALNCIADKAAGQLAHKQPLKSELTALRAFVDQLLVTAGEQLPSIDAATAAALLHSLARLANTGQVPAAYAPELVDSLLLHNEPSLSSLTPSQLTQMVWALKQLQHTPTEAWCRSLYTQTLQQLPQLKGFEAALLVRGLAVIQAPTPPAAWSATILSHTEGLLDSMEPKHVSLLLLGLGGLKVQPSRAWLSTATAALRSKFDQMGPQAMSNIMWAFAKLGVLPDRAWLTAYFSTSLQMLDSLNRQELSLDMWALSKLRLEPGDQWLDEYFDATEAQLTRFTLRDLAIVGYALAKLGLRPPSTWLRRYCALLLRYKAGLYRNKMLLTQVMVALDSFKVPRMDMWRREMYAAAGYRLYKYPNWRQRVRVQPGVLAAGAGFNRRRLGRRGSRLGLLGSSSRLPPVLRSGDWGVMDAMGGGGGVLGGSMGSYEELVPAAAAPAGGSGGAVKRTLPNTGLVRPQRPSSAGSSNSSSVAEASSTLGSMWEGGI